MWGSGIGMRGRLFRKVVGKCAWVAFESIFEKHARIVTVDGDDCFKEMLKKVKRKNCRLRNGLEQMKNGKLCDVDACTVEIQKKVGATKNVFFLYRMCARSANVEASVRLFRAWKKVRYMRRLEVWKAKWNEHGWNVVCWFKRGKGCVGPIL